MSFSDDTLNAFADGELDDITRHEVELAMRLDPQLAARVRRHQAQRSNLRSHGRSNVFDAFSPTIDQALPQRAQGAAGSGKVVHLSAVRAARNAPQPLPPPPQFRVRPRKIDWTRWATLAGAVVAGLLAGAAAMQGWTAARLLVALDADSGTLSARGDLASGLNQQLSGQTADVAVRVGSSFVSKDGVYCRSFTLPNTGGLACRDGGGWQIAVLAATEGGGGEYRQAGKALPRAVLDAIDARITGKPLDLEGERAARQQGWKR